VAHDTLSFNLVVTESDSVSGDQLTEQSYAFTRGADRIFSYRGVISATTGFILPLDELTVVDGFLVINTHATTSVRCRYTAASGGGETRFDLASGEFSLVHNVALSTVPYFQGAGTASAGTIVWWGPEP